MKDNTVIVGCKNNLAYALNLKTGRDSVYSITTKDDIVIVGCSYDEDVGYADVKIKFMLLT
ncbi:hypothetical protein JH146_1588 [Methanocaldococcus bathoardescens]|uniref:Uncharacterized protein n=1 Tax=Methanocaldococcus bathoardescens TaxID=1301915 RepID=A0A076LD36_9EURY|nr:hypothetical protein JH146_1588 [Methanocaldococcus bathoardescens]